MNAKAKVWCRDCGEEMAQYPYGILAFSCRNCKLKATVSYDKMPVIGLNQDKYQFKVTREWVVNAKTCADAYDKTFGVIPIHSSSTVIDKVNKDDNSSNTNQ
jgi:hypothetical protein